MPMPTRYIGAQSSTAVSVPVAVSLALTPSPTEILTHDSLFSENQRCGVLQHIEIAQIDAPPPLVKFQVAVIDQR